METNGVVGWDIIWKKCPKWFTVIAEAISVMMGVFGGMYIALVVGVRYVVV